MQEASEIQTQTTSRPMKSPFKTPLATVPRIMRSRIVKATKQKSTKPKKLLEADMGNQRIARSGSGKVAFGPWTGAFGHESNSHDSVLYIDRCGSTHTDLNEQTALPDLQQQTETAPRSPKAHRKGTVLDPAAIVEPPSDEKTMKLRSREVKAIQQKSVAPFTSRQSCGKQVVKGGRYSNRMCVINQPKKGF